MTDNKKSKDLTTWAVVAVLVAIVVAAVVITERPWQRPQEPEAETAPVGVDASKAVIVLVDPAAKATKAVHESLDGKEHVSIVDATKGDGLEFAGAHGVNEGMLPYAVYVNDGGNDALVPLTDADEPDELSDSRIRMVLAYAAEIGEGGEKS